MALVVISLQGNWLVAKLRGGGPCGCRDYLDGKVLDGAVGRASMVTGSTAYDMDITNKTKKPLSVPLPGGKKLFLQPGKTGQVTAKALQFGPLVKLIEAGDLESADGGGSGATPKGGSKVSGGSGSAPHKGGSGAMRQSGDR